MLTAAPHDMSALLRELTPIFRKALENDQLVIAPEMTARDVAGWDSLSHMSLIVEIETHFKIKFKLREIVRFKNVGDMCRAIWIATQ